MNPQNNSSQNQSGSQTGTRDLNQGGDLTGGMSSENQDAGSLYNADRGVTTDRNQGFPQSTRDESLSAGIGTRDGAGHFTGTQNQDTDGGLSGQRGMATGFTSQQQRSGDDADRISGTDLPAAGSPDSRWAAGQELETSRDLTGSTSRDVTGSTLTEGREDSLTGHAGTGRTTDYNRDRADVTDDDVRDHDANRDPITGAPGSHPVGTGIGAAGAGAVGAAIGAVGGPVGMAIGAAVGAVVGGLAGKATAEAVNPTDYDENHWRENYTREPHHDSSYDFDDYDPAYRYGTASAEQYRGRAFDDHESDLERGWENVKGKSRLNWEKAKGAVRSAWHKTERALPGDADRDGR